jgi:hypothetical protein
MSHLPETRSMGRVMFSSQRQDQLPGWLKFQKLSIKSVLIGVLWVVWVGILLHLGSGCSNPSTQVVTPVEGGNPVIMSRVVMPSGEGVPLAQVVIIPKEAWQEMLQGKELRADTLFSDSLGFFTLQADSGDVFGVTIVHSNSGYFGYLNITSDSMYQEMPLSPLVDLKGTIEVANLLAANVYLPGSPMSTQVDPNGHWAMQRVPPGTYSPVVQMEFLDEKQLVPLPQQNSNKPGGTITFSDTLQQLGVLLLEDFEDRSILGALDPIVKQSYWFAWNDVADGGNSFLEPAWGMDDLFYDAIIDSAGIQGRYLKIRYDLTKSPYDSAYAAVGLKVVPGMNLSQLDSIVFYCRGAGEFTLQVADHEAWRNPKGLNAKITPTEQWQRIVLTPKDFKRHSPVSWEQASPYIMTFTYLFQQPNGYLHLDELRLFGNTSSFFTPQ